MSSGLRNSILDVPGISVGHSHNTSILTGATCIAPASPCTEFLAVVDCRGGGPGSREIEILRSENLVDKIHALVLSGGSANGLDAASGVSYRLRMQGKGLKFIAPNSKEPVTNDGSQVVVPIVPSVILFDILNGGDKSLIEKHTYFELGEEAYDHLQTTDCPNGNYGAGMGATAGVLKGGIGSCSYVESLRGFVVGALVAVNSLGSVTMPGRPDFWAKPYELGGEFGNLSMQIPFSYSLSLEQPGICKRVLSSGNKNAGNTTIGCVALNVNLSHGQAQRVAIMAQDGISRAIRPVHTPYDGDAIFVLIPNDPGNIEIGNDWDIVTQLGSIAADCVARAIARGVFEAESAGIARSWKDTFAQDLNDR